MLAGIPIEELENFVGANLYSHMPLLTTASVFKHRVLLDSVNHSITPSLPFQKEQVSFAADVTWSGSDGKNQICTVEVSWEIPKENTGLKSAEHEQVATS